MSAVMVGAPAHEVSDGTLVAAVVAGDQTSADVLFRRYHTRLIRRMGYWTRDRAHAEDLAQDAWLKALSALERFDPQLPFWPWLRSIGDNTARSELRRTLAPCGRRRTVAVDETVLDLVPSRDEHSRVDDGAEVAAALADIPVRQRDAFLAVAHAGTPIHVAAGEFGLNENAFRQLYHRARRSLRERVDTVLGTAPVMWLQRWVSSLRDVLENPATGSGLQAGAAAVGTAVALLVLAPGSGLSAAAAEAPASPTIITVASARDSWTRDAGRSPAGADAAIARARTELEWAKLTGTASDTESSRPRFVAVPQAPPPVRVHSERPKDPVVHIGVRPRAVGIQTHDVEYDADENSRTPVVDAAGCQAAKATTPLTYCEE